MVKYLLCIWILFITPLAESNNYSELVCLAKNIHHEASGEPERGKLAVALVTLNRVNHEKFAKTICGVVYEKNQFSWTKKPKRRIPTKAWNEALVIAEQVLSNPEILGDFQATHFHNLRVNPRWKLKRVAVIGNHIFYK